LGARTERGAIGASEVLQPRRVELTAISLGS